MTKHRSHSAAFKRQVAEEFLAGDTLHALSKRHDIARQLCRLMKEHDLQPKRRRRYVVTTDSSHADPIFKNLTKDLVVERPNQLWIADLTYVAISGGFVCLAAILDAWSRRVVGYAISRSMDARLTVAALKTAIRTRQPPKDCIHRSDQGSQHASEIY